MKNKEYKTGLVHIKWNHSRAIILIVLSVINHLIHIYITRNPAFPFWLNAFGPMMASAIDGPLFGAITAGAWLLISLVFGEWSTYTFLTIVMLGAVAATFGVLLRLGLFGNKKSIPWAFAIIVLVDTMLGISTSMAAYGSATYTNSITNFIYNAMIGQGAGEMAAGAVSYVAASIVDKGLIVVLVMLIMRIIPNSVASAFSIDKQIPSAVFVNTDSEEEFQAEKEKLEQKARERLEKANEAETAVAKK